MFNRLGVMAYIIIDSNLKVANQSMYLSIVSSIDFSVQIRPPKARYQHAT